MMIINSNYVEILSYFSYKYFFLQSIISVLQILLVSQHNCVFFCHQFWSLINWIGLRGAGLKLMNKASLNFHAIKHKGLNKNNLQLWLSWFGFACFADCYSLYTHLSFHSSLLTFPHIVYLDESMVYIAYFPFSYCLLSPNIFH